MEITIGMKGEAFTDVSREDTAKEVGSGDLLVYARLGIWRSRWNGLLHRQMPLGIAYGERSAI